ncbi:MAG: hypothetical protein K2J27_07475 [Duncaniella sp.]|nr:hypothetical protein [Duncaniella sp.]
MNTNKVNTTNDNKAQWEANKAEFERLCTEQEGLYAPEFERVFTALYEIAPDQREVYNTHGWNMGAVLPEVIDTDTLNRALSATGVSDEVRRDFIRYAEIVLQGKRLMQQNALLNIEIEMANRPQEQQPEGWRFYPINIIASPDLHNVIAEVLEQDAQRGEGLFSNITEIAELPDVALDEFLSVEVYNVICSLQPYLGVLNRYGVTGQTLGKEFTRYLFAYLKQVADHIKANTDRPQVVKTYIFEAIKNLDGIKIWGLIFQILTLQGILSLLENCTLKEGENGYNEVQDLCNWIADLLGEKLVWFTLTGGVYGEDDKERLQPLCDYLYNTELGQTVQQVIFERDKRDTPDLKEPNDRPEAITLPDKLTTPEALKIFEQARELGLMDRDYKWLKGLQLLACFAREMSLKLRLGKGNNSDGTPRISWQPFERLFNISNGKLRANYNDVQKTGQNPSDHTLIDRIFK